MTPIFKDVFLNECSKLQVQATELQGVKVMTLVTEMNTQFIKIIWKFAMNEAILTKI